MGWHYGKSNFKIAYGGVGGIKIESSLLNLSEQKKNGTTNSIPGKNETLIFCNEWMNKLIVKCKCVKRQKQ